MNRSAIYHPQIEDLLSYLDGDRHWVARRAARRHLSRCGACRTEVEDIRRTESAIADHFRDMDFVMDLPGNWRTEMRADLGERLNAASRRWPVSEQPGW